MRIVVALGGNALLQRGQVPDAEAQVENIRLAARELAPLTDDHEVVITHGNGPQVGVLAMESAADPRLTKSFPFDALGAMTQGLIGYWILQAMGNERPYRQFASIINQTLVDAHDPGFANPTKFVGELYAEEEARELADRHGWQVKQDGDRWRRVVASPRPREIIEGKLIDHLLDESIIVVCAGGGGVPVVRTETGDLRGVEAVIDKDLSAALIARRLHADRLLVLTDVGHVMDGFGTDHETPIRHTTPSYLRSLDLPSGSMGPKVDAVCQFVEAGGPGVAAAIGNLGEAQALVHGELGTYVTSD
ncbi:carbamate kinase [Ornithinimicrobium cryptoxanthini]|uniref:Carbamate kinase n=1 Tax=Ornithinimicrobium cryptoxanthini TaxID=2934161 RepID=A0ABY4YHC9_9MICO|nr:carbamate kinase [Ornithinimicrobium cryptoxanthini]USQ76180.1 carbamate kinase [Ornithinimicrobium cryptoxanthini]